MPTTKFVKELYNEDLVYSSVVFGMGFWIDNQGLFMSAPSYATGGGCDRIMRFPCMIGKTGENLQSIITHT